MIRKQTPSLRNGGVLLRIAAVTMLLGVIAGGCQQASPHSSTPLHPGHNWSHSPSQCNPSFIFATRPSAQSQSFRQTRSDQWPRATEPQGYIKGYEVVNYREYRHDYERTDAYGQPRKDYRRRLHSYRESVLIR